MKERDSTESGIGMSITGSCSYPDYAINVAQQETLIAVCQQQGAGMADPRRLVPPSLDSEMSGNRALQQLTLFGNFKELGVDSWEYLPKSRNLR